MARGRDNPREWNALLVALESDDTKTAQKIAIMYGFDNDKQPSKHNYFCKLPDGEILTFGNAEGLADFLGIKTRAVRTRFDDGNLTWRMGKRKGYQIWRKLKWEDE